jgi:hypothetical protein
MPDTALAAVVFMAAGLPGAEAEAALEAMAEAIVNFILQLSNRPIGIKIARA